MRKTISSCLLAGAYGAHRPAHYCLLFGLRAGDTVMTLVQIVNMSLAALLAAVVE